MAAEFTLRRCLSCDRKFKSTHAGHRRCGDCVKKLEKAHNPKVFPAGGGGRSHHRGD